jgi:hypothetical protein
MAFEPLPRTRATLLADYAQSRMLFHSFRTGEAVQAAIDGGTFGSDIEQAVYARAEELNSAGVNVSAVEVAAAVVELKARYGLLG